MQPSEYRRIAAAETAHWWYAATRALLGDVLSPHLAPDSRILDAGCGTGATGGWLASRGRIVAVDAEPLALALYRESRPATALIAAEIERLPFAPESFDAALCVTVLYHENVVDPIAAVREIARTVRPGGVICLLEPGVRRLRRAHDRMTHTARRFSRADMRQLMRASGLRPLRATGAYAFLVAPALVKAALERGRTASDLGDGAGTGSAILARLASLERRWLAHADLPMGLSILGLAVK